jgi:DNA-binding transcriptional regulator YdaS (Cro superfamily)
MVERLTPLQARDRAIELLGSQGKLARLCGVSNTAVWKWVKSSKPIPAEHVLTVEAAVGVSRHVLRPDIYPIESSGCPSSPEAASAAVPKSAAAGDRSNSLEGVRS